jgi:biotin transport system substrate-specific component
MSLVALFAALTGIGAFIRIPIPYVPLSLQNLMVMFAGLILGGRLAALSQLVYILVGLLGIPIFVHGGGLGYVLQPSFGYLLGFIPGAYVIGRLIEKREPLSRPFLTCWEFPCSTLT